MKKIKFMFLIVIFMIFICSGVSNIYALGTGYDGNIFNSLEDGEVDNKIGNTAYKVYGTIANIIQVIAIIGGVYVGYRYMKAGANEKGEIKQTLLFMIIGVILVFAANTVIKFVIKSGNDLIGDSVNNSIVKEEKINDGGVDGIGESINNFFDGIKDFFGI